MRRIWSVLVVSAVFCSASLTSRAQNQGQDSEKRESACRLEFSINELEDGKKINVRHYSMNLTGGIERELKIGTRVPVEGEQGSFQYLDVGTNIRSRMYGKEDAPILSVTTEITNFAVPDQSARGGHPLLRQMVISGSTVLIFDKPTIIGAVDDPNSKRQYQLEVIATKIK